MELNIKVLIKSVYYSETEEFRYKLYLCPDNTENIIFRKHLALIANKFDVYMSSNYGGVETVEPELTQAFCILANRMMKDCRFTMGNERECNVDFETQRHVISKNIIGKDTNDLSYLYIKNMEEEMYSPYSKEKTKEHHLLMELHKSIDWEDKQKVFEHGRWISSADEYTRNTEQYKRYRKLNLYRYSLAIHTLVTKGQVNMNEPIPVLDLQYIVNNSIAEWGEAWKKLFWAHPATLIDKDIYPLDLAEIAGNEEMMFDLLNKGAERISIIKESCFKNAACSKLFFMFNQARNTAELSLVYDFLGRYRDEIDQETLMTVKTSLNQNSPYVTINSGDGRSVIESWYRCALRLQDTGCVEKLFTEYRTQLLYILNYISPFTGESRNAENVKKKILNRDFNEYITFEILPHIKDVQHKILSPKDYGIWGFDARTGNPIHERDLYIY